ncbi:MAG: putative major capsid protein [Prokaryotic dsDNA virus sp.]|nr:hypothetical protein [Phycisphaerae bacterium]QDP45972.1 MAG: putative major capsid protein [Prokaryotic dsDNA virus sp.]|tara:strand:+ start:1179 stop:2147 length:969 start_codon:yes stop_codon:yes gene_type:complete
MSQSDMVVFNQYVAPAIAELFPQMIDKFNAASNNTIVLTSEGFDGNYFEESFYNAIHGSQRRVDRYAANSSVASTDLTQAQYNTVKVAGGFGPVLFEPAQMTWLRKPTQEGIAIASTQFAEAMLADQLNTAIAALVAAIGNNAAMVNDVSATEKVTQQAINGGLAKFGDASQQITALVMTGAQRHNLVDEAIANSNNLFEIGGVAVRDGSSFGQGRSIIVTDSPALVTADPFQNVLGLTTGAAMVKDGSDLITNIETNNGKARIETTFQTDYTFGLGLKGYSWDQANGGASPSDAALATGSNWDKVVTSDKHTAGVMIIGQE